MAVGIKRLVSVQHQDATDSILAGVGKDCHPSASACPTPQDSSWVLETVPARPYAAHVLVLWSETWHFQVPQVSAFSFRPLLS